jgi:D-alanyl-D-alanine carboxypeptidase
MKTKVLLVAACCVSADVVHAQNSAPRVGSDVPRFAQSIALEMVQLISSGDSAARARFVEKNFSAAGITNNGRDAQRIIKRLREQSGGVRLVSVERAGGNTFVTVHAPARQRLALINMGWDRTDSTKLRLVEVLKAWNPRVDSIQWPEKRLPESALKSVIEANVSRLAAAGGFSGTALVAHRGRIVFARGYGLANRDDSIANSVSTRYATASMGKMFTAVAIARLIEAGRLRLDDTLATILPDYPNRERARSITIRHLLGHTAGLGDIWSHPAFARGKAYSSNRELAWLIADAPLLFTPGTKWSYSNEGYIVLGAVIEKVSGTSYEDYVRSRIFQPTGMTATANAGNDEVVPHRAVGYRPSDDDVLVVEQLRPNWTFLGETSKASGAGGAYTTVTDLSRFVQALRAGKLLGSIRDTLWVGRSPLPWDASTKYGYGFMRSAVNGREFLGHGGGGGGSGMDNNMSFSADGDWTVIVLGNIDPPGASDLATRLVALVSRQ